MSAGAVVAVPRWRGWIMAVAAIGVAAAAAGYGIWSRSATTTDLKKSVEDAAIPRVQMIQARPGPAKRSLILPGNIAAWYQASIYAQVTGYVSHWYKDYGAEVKAGDVLATVESPSLDAELAAAKAQLATTQANYSLAVLTAKRYSALAGTQAVSQQEVDVQKSTAVAQKTTVEAAQQNVTKFEAMVAFKKLVSPFDGIVTARNVNIGDYVGTQGSTATARNSAQSLFTIADVHKLRVFVSVPQSFSDALKPGVSVSLTLPQEPGKPITAQLLTTARAIDPASRTVVTELVMDNANQEYWPGSFVNVTFEFPSDPNILVVPEQALLFRAQGMQVAVIGADSKVHLQDVRLGRNLGTDVQVTSGVTKDDKLVAAPSLGLLDGQQVKVVRPAAGADPSGNSGVSQPAPAVSASVNAAK